MTSQNIHRLKEAVASQRRGKQLVFRIPIIAFFSNGGGNEESISIEETNRIRAELGLPPLEMDDDPKADEPEESNIDTEGGNLFKEDGVNIVHKAATNLTEDKQTAKIREKLELQKEKHRIYNKVLKTQKGLGESDSDEEGSGVDNFLERMRQQAEKKARAFDSMDQEAEQEAAAQAKKVQQRKVCTRTTRI